MSDFIKFGRFTDLKNANTVIESKDISTKHVKEEDIKEENIEMNQKPNFHCQFCGEMFTNRIDLGNHILHGSSTCLSKT